jgi:WD40 repeat protein
MQDHKGVVNKLKWHAHGNQFITASKDQTIKVRARLYLACICVLEN